MNILYTLELIAIGAVLYIIVEMLYKQLKNK